MSADALDLAAPLDPDDDADAQTRPGRDRAVDGRQAGLATVSDVATPDLDVDGGEGGSGWKVRLVAHREERGQYISAAGPVKVKHVDGSVTEEPPLPAGTNPKSLEVRTESEVESGKAKAIHDAAQRDGDRIAHALERTGIFEYHPPTLAAWDEYADWFDGTDEDVYAIMEVSLPPGPVVVVRTQNGRDRFVIRRGTLQEAPPDGEAVIQRAWDKRKFGPDPLIIVPDRTRPGHTVIDCRCGRKTGQNCPMAHVPVRPVPCLCGREPQRLKNGRLKFWSHRGCPVHPSGWWWDNEMTGIEHAAGKADGWGEDAATVFWYVPTPSAPTATVYRAATITPERQADIDRRDWSPEFDQMSALMDYGDEQTGGLFGIDPRYHAVRRMLIDEGRRALGKLAAKLGGYDAVAELLAAEREFGSTGVPEAETDGLTDLQAQALAWHRAGLNTREMSRTDPEHRAYQVWQRHLKAALAKVTPTADTVAPGR
jgi:hypothetical protein